MEPQIKFVFFHTITIILIINLLKVVKIRGIESHGMLCSGYELDESSDKEGIIELNKKEKNIGDKYLKNTGEKTMDIAITPNRPDCLGIRGIARDLYLLV